MKKLLLIILTLYLGGCASLQPTQEATATAGQTWESQQQQMLALENWQMTGKIGIRTPRDSQSASLYWQQLQQHYQIELTGPLGQGGARIDGNGDGITVDLAGEDPLWAPTPELLMERALGWQFPVRELHYWIKGIPAPHQPYQLSLNQQLPEKIIQKGWEINYLGYLNQNDQIFPRKITISRNDLRITIVAKEWQISP